MISYNKKMIDEFISEYNADYERWFYTWYEGYKPDSKKINEDDDYYEDDEWQDDEGYIRENIMDIIKQEPEYRKMFINDEEWSIEYRDWLIKKN